MDLVHYLIFLFGFLLINELWPTDVDIGKYENIYNVLPALSSHSCSIQTICGFRFGSEGST